MTRPSDITTMRSQADSISDSSDEIMMIALPALASSRTSVMISDFEPMSMPGGRLVEDQDVGLGREPLGDHDLLLVAARERAYRRDRARRS